MRGTFGDHHRGHHHDGIIAAYVGSTADILLAERSRQDHPQARGNAIDFSTGDLFQGSTPQARGA